MDGFHADGIGIGGILDSGFDSKDPAGTAADRTLFNASQYDFFGGDDVEEFELGGDGAEENARFLGLYNDDVRFSSLGIMGEGNGLGCHSGIDDLASVFSKLNTNVGGPRNAGVIGDRRSLSRESSSTADWSQDADFSDWAIQRGFDPENILGEKRWWSQPQSPSSPVAQSKPLYRTTTYPQQQPLLGGPSSPPPPPAPPLLLRHSSVPLNLPPPHAQSTFLSVGSQLRHIAAPYNSLYSRYPPSLVHHQHQQAVAEILRNQFLLGAVQPLAATPYSPTVAAPPRGSNQRAQRPKLRSKYMTVEEIEGILRNLHSAGHGSGDLYVDDYYHQACIAKRAAAGAKASFRPAAITDGPSHRGRNGHHDSAVRSFVQADSAGRFSFTPLRRPPALLQTSATESPDSRPLELEPLVAARVTIEDGFYLLLEVEDIDRVLWDSGSSGSSSAQLRRRRQVLVEGLAASLQLVDPLGRATGLGPNDDVIFLRLTALPKGRKLVSKYLKLVNGTDMARKVCMAVFRHLRFLYGPAAVATTAAVATASLTQAVTVCVNVMDLSGLGACLVAVVCSLEQPPLRPIGGGGGGDGASVVVKAVLDRATQLLSGPSGAAGFSLEVRSLWQASFNAFFGLLSKYCLRKYDAILQSVVRRGDGDGKVAAEVARAVGREMPVELLRASLPHTDEQQQILLREFARRSTTAVAPGFNGGSGSGGGMEPFGPEFVPG
ncbi:protein PAT1 homolog 1-like [Wolffia australiana]